MSKLCVADLETILSVGCVSVFLSVTLWPFVIGPHLKSVRHASGQAPRLLWGSSVSHGPLSSALSFKLFFFFFISSVFRALFVKPSIGTSKVRTQNQGPHPLPRPATTGRDEPCEHTQRWGSGGGAAVASLRNPHSRRILLSPAHLHPDFHQQPRRQRPQELIAITTTLEYGDQKQDYRVSIPGLQLFTQLSKFLSSRHIAFTLIMIK